MKRYLLGIGYRESRIKLLEDASSEDWDNWLGTADLPQGELWREMQRVGGAGDVFVFISGHGVPFRQGEAAPVSRRLLTVKADPMQAGRMPTVDDIRRNLAAIRKLLPPGRTVTLWSMPAFRSGGGWRDPLGQVRADASRSGSGR